MRNPFNHRRGLEPPVRYAPPHLGSEAERRVLVVANDALGEQALVREVKGLASTPRTLVLLLVPALVSPGARLSGDVDTALDQARTRAAAALERIGREHDVAGEISGADPVEAIEDALDAFAADEVIIYTRSERGGLEPWLGGLVRERFAVPVHHRVVGCGSAAHEPDEAGEASYRREFDQAAAARKRKLRLGGLAGAGVVAILMISALVALIQGTGTSQAGTLTAPTKVALSLIPSSKLGPDGIKHDAYTTTDFTVTVGQPVKLRIDNTDTQSHSFFSPGAGVYLVIRPGTHTYTLIVHRAGTFRWLCITPCDSGADGWAMQHPGYMSGYINAT